MIPETQHNNSMTREEFRPCAIANLARMILMSAAMWPFTQVDSLSQESCTTNLVNTGF
jgi:hypothetical protein